MGVIIKPNNAMYTEDMDIVTACEYYKDYTAGLSDEQLKREYEENEVNFHSEPTPKRFSFYKISEQKMLERGLPISKSFVSENGVEMQNY